MPPALIEHTTRRKDGSLHRGPSGVEYHFKPLSDEDPRHVALVSDPEDIWRFEEIGQTLGTFRVLSYGEADGAGGEGAPGLAPGLGATRPEMPAAPPTDPMPMLPDPMAAEPAKVEEPAAEEPEPEPAAENGDALDKMTGDPLRDLFHKELGRKAHHKALDETLRAQIRAKRAER